MLAVTLTGRMFVCRYNAGKEVESPLGPLGLLAVEFFLMHWVEVRRWQDLRKPGSVDQDPIFSQYKLPPHEVGSGSGLQHGL